MNLFKRSLIFVSFFGCCFCLALIGASLGTRHWFSASCRQRYRPIPGSISQITRKNSAVEQHNDTDANPQIVRLNSNEEIYRPNSTGFINFGLFQGEVGLNVGFGLRQSLFKVSETDGLMSQGLWVGTIACLSGGLLFALVGAVFAIVNTATTPIEAITGVTGLYIWNGLAATFDLVAVILWSVMFSSRLSSNVLVEQSSEGWTTEGYETLGYSFWLVVVAIFLHVGNCGLIAYGTREPKLKEELQEPENVTNDILLY